ncbi:MAG: nucleotidyltransferase family protein [Desulfitobacterium hafniense]|nr:nucleotidyltransferase family protein [Desulfitobacterium hafniense]
MNDFNKVLVSPATSILSAIKIIDESTIQIALVVDENGHLLGTITDGDIRRAILKGVSMDDPVRQIMNPKPTVASVYDSRVKILEIMKNKRLYQIPIVDEQGCVVELKILDQILKSPERENWAIIMAGGLGSRLRPLTEDCPKTLLKVGGKPLLETIIENFKEYGFQRFYFCVNYKADMVQNYFGDGSSFGVEIKYIHEENRMGTAGALGLLPEKPLQPIFVMNGDLLTKINFKQLLDYHLEHNAMATMCVREFNLQVPYGVVKIEKNHLVSIEEKPIQRFFISAGIYVLEPKALSYIPQNVFFDMPSLFKELMKGGKKATTFPVREYWMDIGRMGDYEKANGEYKEHFQLGK